MKTSKFKMTEIGEIPTDWEVKRLGEICDILDNRRIPLNDSQRKSGPYPYCGANGVVAYIDRYIYDEDVILIAEDGGNFEDFATKQIAYQMSGKFWVNNHAHVLVAKEGFSQSYIFFQLEHKDITDVISGGTRAKLTRGQLEGLIIVLPPSLAEQKAIAEALSDVDALIAAQEELIEKKRAIKQGAMQELLGMRNVECGMRNVPRRRLAGFSGAWIEKRLGDVCEINPRMEGEIPERFIYVDLESVVGGILTAKKILLRTEAPSRAQRRFKCGDILFQTVRPYQRNNLLVDFDAEDYVASTGYAIIRGIELCSRSEFIYHLVHMDGFVNDVIDRCTGTSYPAINPRRLAEIMIHIPEEVAEQQAIAGVLSDMDAEIAALEADRAKYESIKQGMMQELLTGKTRLV